MNIYYDNKVLYVDIEDVLDSNMNEILKNQVFDIIDNYSIESIVIETITKENNIYLNDLIKEYKSKYHGKIKIR